MNKLDRFLVKLVVVMMMNYRLKHILLYLSLGLTISSIATDRASKKRAYPFGAAKSEKKHLCPYCGSTCKETGDLNKHIRIHTGERPYKCGFPGCDSAFKQSSDCLSHRRTHTGERPYKCGFPGCDKAFKHSGDCLSHRHTHTGERPYKCDFSGCNSAFTRSGNLSRHRRTHTKDTKVTDRTTPATSTATASTPIPPLPAILTATAEHVSATDLGLPQNPDEMDELDGFLEKVPWKS